MARNEVTDMLTTLLTEPIRAEHQALLPHIEELGAAATWIPTAPALVVHEKLIHALAFLQNELVPHAKAEEETLYPAVEGCMQAPGATDTMSRDHVEVLRLVDELATLRDNLGDPPSEADRDRIAAILHGLHAIVALHFAKEEEIYLPILDRCLTADSAAELFERMHHVAHLHKEAAVV